MEKPVISVELLHIGEDYSTLKINGKEVDVSEVLGKMVKRLLQLIVRTVRE